MLRTSLLLSSIALLGLLSCSSKGTGGTASAEVRGGADLFKSYCAICHGDNGQGTSMNLGPAFSGIAQHWDADKLLEYIADPATFAANVDRLGERSMTAIPDDVGPEERARLVEYALSLMN